MVWSMDDDLWHVRIAPDEVKQLTLEQLDDLFRLEVIEADTLIWQPGMTEWLPLSVVAGLDEEAAETEKVSIPVSAPPPRPVAPPKPMAQTATAWPPRSAPPPPKPMTATASSWPPPQAWSNPPARSAPAPVGWTNPPPRPSVSPYASTVAQQGRSAPPPSAAPRPVVNPLASPVPSFAPPSAPLSTAPLARTEYTRRSSGGGWLFVVALAAGAAVTLYRNDLVHAAARSVGSESTYLQLEKALGGPGFGTPRAVEQMAAAAAALTATSETPSPVSTSTPSSPTTSAPATTSTTTTSASTPSTETAHSSDTPSTAATSASTPAPTSAPAATSVNTSAKPAASRPASAPVHAAPAHAVPSHASAAPEKPDAMFTTPKKGKKAKGSDYDPLNGSL